MTRAAGSRPATGEGGAERALTLPVAAACPDTGGMNERISRAEIGKDAVQSGVEATTQAVGAVTGIVIGAVGEVAKTLGGLATEFFEISDGARRAMQDQDPED